MSLLVNVEGPGSGSCLNLRAGKDHSTCTVYFVITPTRVTQRCPNTHLRPLTRLHGPCNEWKSAPELNITAAESNILFGEIQRRYKTMSASTPSRGSTQSGAADGSMRVQDLLTAIADDEEASAAPASHASLAHPNGVRAKAVPSSKQRPVIKRYRGSVTATSTQLETERDNVASIRREIGSSADSRYAFHVRPQAETCPPWTNLMSIGSSHGMGDSRASEGVSRTQNLSQLSEISPDEATRHSFPAATPPSNRSSSTGRRSDNGRPLKSRIRFTRRRSGTISSLGITSPRSRKRSRDKGSLSEEEKESHKQQRGQTRQ